MNRGATLRADIEAGDQTDRTRSLSRDDWPGLAVAIAFCELAGIVPGYATREDVTEWFEGLEKPALQPPSVVFVPVWTVLYALMGVAVYLVRREAGDTPEGRVGIGLFVAQLGINVGWSFVVFGGRSVFASFAMSVPLVLAVFATVLAFARVNRRAALLLVPYLVWTAFATVLGYQTWRLNR